MAIAQALISELRQEAKSARAMLERVPGDKLDWKPHVKSMSLGTLATHVATLAGGLAKAGAREGLAIEDFPQLPDLTSAAALVAAFDQSVAQAAGVLEGIDDAAMMGNWTLTRGGVPMFTLPRIGLFRSIVLNHLYHHRGQLSVYLRLLDVPVPSIYGPSADENPFG